MEKLMEFFGKVAIWFEEFFKDNYMVVEIVLAGLVVLFVVLFAVFVTQYKKKKKLLADSYVTNDFLNQVLARQQEELDNVNKDKAKLIELHKQELDSINELNEKKLNEKQVQIDGLNAQIESYEYYVTEKEETDKKLKEYAQLEQRIEAIERCRFVLAPIDQISRDDLYELSKELGIKGMSKANKETLYNEVKKALSENLEK